MSLGFAGNLRSVRGQIGISRDWGRVILNLDERLRWVVLTQALPQPGRRDLFTEDEIRAEMKRLSPATRQAILNRAAPMPPDPLLQRMAPGMHSIGEALLTDRPLPDPTEHLPPEWRDAIREGLHQDREMLERQRRESQTPRSDPP